MMKTRRGFPPSSVRRLPHSVYCEVLSRFCDIMVHGRGRSCACPGHPQGMSLPYTIGVMHDQVNERIRLLDSPNRRCDHEAPLDTRMPAAVPGPRLVSMLRPAGRRPGGRGRDGDGDGRSLSRRRVRLAGYLPCFRAGWREVSDFRFWIGLIQHRHLSGKSRSGSNRRALFLFLDPHQKNNPKSKIGILPHGGPHWPPAAYMFCTL